MTTAGDFFRRVQTGSADLLHKWEINGRLQHTKDFFCRYRRLTIRLEESAKYPEKAM
jgi:hypothetical protein